MKVLVSGSSSGIGLALCRQLLDGGHQVVGLSRRPGPLDQAAFSHCPIDLADLDALPARLGELARQHGPFDAVVCNAGQGIFGDLEQFSPAQIRAAIDLNFTSHAYVVRALLPAMKQRRRGHIVFTGSEAARRGAQKGSLYCAAKFALRGFAQALREECARRHIRVTLVNPGMVRTPFFDGLDFAPGADPANYLEPGDVAAAILLALQARPGTVIDEIDLSPQKKAIEFGRSHSAPPRR